MKKFFPIVFAVLLMLVLSCCSEKAVQPTTVVTTVEASTDPPPTSRNQNEVTFAPENIKMGSKYLWLEKRLIYITSFPGANDLFPIPFAYDVLADEQYAQYGRRSHSWAPEMCLVTLVKRYDVPREKFEEAIKKAAKELINEGRDLSEEQWELPNPDIIYTFNNEIIDAYYRRENPVAPDWLGTERAKDFTYESYSEYLKANPQ